MHKLGRRGDLKNNQSSKITEKRHIEAAKQLKADPDTPVRNSDKAATFVLMITSEYLGKINAVLNDKIKFTRITKDPTETLRRK